MTIWWTVTNFPLQIVLGGEMTQSGGTEAANSSDGWWNQGRNIHNAKINQIKDAVEESKEVECSACIDEAIVHMLLIQFQFHFSFCEYYQQVGPQSANSNPATVVKGTVTFWGLFILGE